MKIDWEEFRDIQGYEGLYQVSSLGRVKSLKDNHNIQREKILKGSKNKVGYLQVILCKEGKKQTYLVHRLVATAFILNPNNFPSVNHKDENKENNQVDNLEWLNYSQQQKHGTCQQRRTEKISKQVYQYDKNGTLIKIWQSTMECERSGYNHGAVAECCRNCFNREGNNVYKDFIWSYYPL